MLKEFVNTERAQNKAHWYLKLCVCQGVEKVKGSLGNECLG